MRLVARVKGLSARLLRRFVYQPNRRKTLTQSVLFETFSGKQVGDSPLDLALELQKTHPELNLIFTITPGQNRAPAGMTGLRQGSGRWLKALARSKYLVNNANFPSYFQKREGQFYLQTWHGTPLKMIGLDIRNNRTSSTYQATMRRESDYWDYLISPNAYCSKIFPQAFSTQAQLVEFGYPRNDRLFQVSAEERNALREKLGITDSKETLVLYAPTWRDTERGSQGGWKSVNHLPQELPKGFTLLYRGHSNTQASHQATNQARSIDVTFYPDMAELFVAADVLVTDYSSVMFDFSVTGKPMIFLTPDLKDYETDRGFYFDFRSEAPGPICLTGQEVIEKLAQLPKIASEFKAKYRTWQTTYNHGDDGGAASRVVKKVWGPAQ